MDYLPFNLEIALAHPERIITRDGRKIEQITYFEKVKNSYPLIIQICDENDITNYTTDGLRLINSVNNSDLFLLPELKTCWINLVENNKDMDLSIFGPYKTYNEAKDHINSIPNGYKVISSVLLTNH